MSDTFDHMCDAYDQFVNMGEELGEDPDNRYKPYNTFGRISDPLYYHRKYNFLSIKIRTKDEKGAYLMETAEGHFWVPKSLCRRLDEERGTVWIWRRFEPQILDGCENEQV